MTPWEVLVLHPSFEWGIFRFFFPTLSAVSVSLALALALALGEEETTSAFEKAEKEYKN